MTQPADTLDIESDSNGASALIERGWFLQYGDPNRGRRLAERGLQAARKNHDPIMVPMGELVLLAYEVRYGKTDVEMALLDDLQQRFEGTGSQQGRLRLGYLRGYLTSREDKAAEAYSELRALLPDLPAGPSVDSFMIYNALGANAYEAGMLEDSLRFSMKALSTARMMSSTSHQALILSNLGSTHHELGNYEDAIRFLVEAYQLVGAAAMHSMAPLVAGNLAMCQLAINAHQAAYETISPYLDLSADRVKVGKADRAFFEAIAAHTFAARGDLPRASDAIHTALNRVEQSGDRRMIAHCWWVKGMIERGQGNIDGALVALKTAESLIHDINDFFYPLQVNRELSQVYAELGEWQHAYHYLDKYQHLYQQALGSASRARLYTMQVQSELDEAERERDFALLKQAEAERARGELETLNHELAAKVEEIERLQVQLREQAVRDPLTDLYNRRYLTDELANEIKLAERRYYRLCVVLIDLDHFKSVNDNYGHPMGDRVLIELSKLLKANIRGSDFACRFGGEEFCLVLADIGIEQAMIRVDFLRQQFNKLTVRQGAKKLDQLTFSAGVAEYPTHGRDSQKLLRAADRALYRAKGSGRNQALAAE